MSNIISLLVLILAVSIHSISAQNSIPYRQLHSFEIALDHNLKRKPAIDENDVSYEYRTPTITELLPHLEVIITLTELFDEEYRIKVIDNFGAQVINKRLKGSQMTLNINVGFVEDIREKLVPHLYQILVMNKDKKVLSKITFEINEDGGFLLNDQFHSNI